MAVKIEGAEPEISYEGAVLDTGEINGYDDSDFYAVVWDEAAQCVKRVEYATTRGWTYNNYAKVDATAEVLAKAEAWLAKYIVGVWTLRESWEAEMPRYGRRVKVVKGRKVAIGATGEVVWFGEDRFARNFYKGPRLGPSVDGMRIGVKLDSGEVVFMSAENVEVIGKENYRKSEADLAERAVRWAQDRNFRTVGAGLGFVA